MHNLLSRWNPNYHRGAKSSETIIRNEHTAPLYPLITSLEHAKPYGQAFSGGLRIFYGVQLQKSPSGEDRLNWGKITDDTTYVAVFDGHAGKGAAEFCCKSFETVLKRNIQIKDDHNSYAIPVSDFPQAITDSFLQVHADFKSQFPSDKSGTTAVLVIQQRSEVFVSWVGDSEAYLFDQNSWKHLTTPVHRACDAEQQLRIKQKSEELGYKFLNSVEEFSDSATTYQLWFSSNNTKLTSVIPESERGKFPGPPEAAISLSRAIGDFRFGDVLLPEPDYTNFTVDSNKLMVCGSDGLWDKVSPEDILALFHSSDYSAEYVTLLNCDMTTKQLGHDETALLRRFLQSICKAILVLAKDRWGEGARDDITVVVCWLQPWKDGCGKLGQTVFVD